MATAAAAAAAFHPLYVGSAELARHVTVDGVAEVPRSFSPPVAGSALGVVGSVSDTTLTQLDRLPDKTIVKINGPTLVEETCPAEAAARAASRIDEGYPAVLTAATSDADIDRTLAAGRERGLSSAKVRDCVRDGLAAAAAAALREASPSGLFLTGGDVAVAVARELGATSVTLTGAEVETGIPIGTLADGAGAGLPLVTKAGGFGSPETINECLSAL